MIIEEDNLTLAWARAFLKVYNDKEDASLIVNVTDIGHGEPREILEVRKNLDRLLESRGRPSATLWPVQSFPCHYGIRGHPGRDFMSGIRTSSHG